MDSASLCAPCPQMHRGTPPEDTGWTGKCEEGLSHQSPREEAHRPGCSRRSHAGCPQSSHRGVTPTENSYTVFHFLPSVAHQESLTPECKLDFTPHFIAKRNPLPITNLREVAGSSHGSVTLEHYQRYPFPAVIFSTAQPPVLRQGKIRNVAADGTRNEEIWDRGSESCSGLRVCGLQPRGLIPELRMFSSPLASNGAFLSGKNFFFWKL